MIRFTKFTAILMMVGMIAGSGISLSVKQPDAISDSKFNSNTGNETSLEKKIERRIGNDSEKKKDIKKQIERKLEQKTKEMQQRRNTEKKRKGFLSSLFGGFF